MTAELAVAAMLTDPCRSPVPLPAVAAKRVAEAACAAFRQAPEYRALSAAAVALAVIEERVADAQAEVAGVLAEMERAR